MKPDNSHIKLGQRIKQSKFFPHKWQPTNIIPPDTACVIILCGSATKDERKANSYAKIIRNLLKYKKLPVYSVAYQEGTRNLRQDREAVLARYDQANPNYSYIKHVTTDDKYYVPNYIRELYAMTLAPRLRLDDETKAPLALAAQRLNMIPFITHCQGSTVIQQMEYLMQTDMQNLGYTKAQQQYLFRQIHSLNIAPVSPIGKTETTAFKFLSLKDDVALSVYTPQTKYITERLEEVDKPKMSMSVFRPTANETIFAVGAFYDENAQSPDEHCLTVFTDKIDDDRTIAGDRLNMMFTTLLNLLETNALKNKNQLSELPDIFKEPQFKRLLEEAQANRYNFITDEINLIRRRRRPKSNKKQSLINVLKNNLLNKK